SVKWSFRLPQPPPISSVGPEVQCEVRVCCPKLRGIHPRHPSRDPISAVRSTNGLLANSHWQRKMALGVLRHRQGLSQYNIAAPGGANDLRVDARRFVLYGFPLSDKDPGSKARLVPRLYNFVRLRRFSMLSSHPRVVSGSFSSRTNISTLLDLSD